MMAANLEHNLPWLGSGVEMMNGIAIMSTFKKVRKEPLPALLMYQTSHFPYWLLLLALALTFCANPIPLRREALDEQPPQLFRRNRRLNQQTRFEPQRIELTFDEWFEMQDVFNQVVVVSPPLSSL